MAPGATGDKAVPHLFEQLSEDTVKWCSRGYRLLRVRDFLQCAKISPGSAGSPLFKNDTNNLLRYLALPVHTGPATCLLYVRSAPPRFSPRYYLLRWLRSPCIYCLNGAYQSVRCKTSIDPSQFSFLAIASLFACRIGRCPT